MVVVLASSLPIDCPLFKNADIILVMVDGNIVEHGNHQELMAAQRRLLPNADGAGVEGSFIKVHRLMLNKT